MSTTILINFETTTHYFICRKYDVIAWYAHINLEDVTFYLLVKSDSIDSTVMYIWKFYIKILYKVFNLPDVRVLDLVVLYVYREITGAYRRL